MTCGMPLVLIGRYLPIKLLKRGGFGAVFLARDRYTPSMSLCVVKQFQPAFDLNPQQLQVAHDLFEREGHVLEQLGKHPQIPQLFACFEVAAQNYQNGKLDRYFYLVLEFIDGRNLEEELHDKGTFSEEEVMLLLQDLLPVLQFVHECGSIHRDIKPANIMRDRQEALYLLDFGSVKQAARGLSDRKGAPSTGVFTPGYAPPEQIQCGQIYPSTDLYALGATCVELLTGKPPTDLVDAMNYQWSWRNYAQVSDRLAEILDRMLLPIPNERFQSAAEVLALLPTQISHQADPAASYPHIPITPVNTLANPRSSPTWQPEFALREILTGAAFIGFEACLLYIALSSLLPIRGIRMGVWGMVLGGLIFIQYRRSLSQRNSFLIAAITLASILLIPALRGQWDIQIIFSLAILSGASAIAIATLSRLIYKLLSTLL
jgi:serine/threonine-protein kinase